MVDLTIVATFGQELLRRIHFGTQVSRPTCDATWRDGRTRVRCERYAVVSAGRLSYCSKHAGRETNITQYK